MILGESPGRSESRATEPFVGASGRLLRTWLAEFGLLSPHSDPSQLPASPSSQESQVEFSSHLELSPGRASEPVAPIITNALCCWPARVDLRPTEDELRACRPHLEATLAYARADWILALGGVALSSIIPGAVISADRGRVLRARGHWGEAWVVGTFHPAWALRNPGQAYLVREDIAWFRFWSLGVFEPWEGAHHERAS